MAVGNLRVKCVWCSRTVLIDPHGKLPRKPDRREQHLNKLLKGEGHSKKGCPDQPGKEEFFVGFS